VDLQLMALMNDAQRALNKTAWGHIDAGRFDQAEVVLRELIAGVGPEDHSLLFHLFGVLGSACNSQDHFDQGTEAYRRSLEEAQRIGPSAQEIGVAKYFPGNQYLLFGDHRDAMEVVEPLPDGAGHVHCLLGAVAAKALWKLERHDEARTAAQRAIDAAPTDERRAELSEELGHILGT
jgi:tetratricopeptide (TPR) repeat protein